MKYAKYLARQSIPEWSEHYFKYKKLKKQLKILVRISESRPSEFAESQQNYVDLLYDELESVNTFFEKKEKELQDQYLQLKALLADSLQQEPSKHHFLPFPSLSKRHGKKTIQETGLIRNDSSPAPITPTLLPETKEEPKLEPQAETPVPATPEATLQPRSFPPPPIDTSFKSAAPSQRSPMRDSEIPQPFVPHTDEKQPKGVILARRYRFAIKRALEEMHRGFGMLKEFSALNSVGFRKIIKKHDKVPKFPSLVYFLEQEVYQCHFHTSTVPQKLMSEIELAYANLFTQGNFRQAVDKLQIPNLEHQHDWVSFRFGMCIGACLILALYLCGKSPNTTDNSPFSTNVMFVFRFLGIPVFWLWTFATVMLIWNSVRINYVFIFGWDPRKHMTPRILYEISAALSFLWLAFFTCYYNSALGYYPFAYIYGPIYPLIMLLLVTALIVSPFNFLYRSSRWWMFKTIARIVRTPLLPVKFKDFFYTNQFTSLKYAFSDFGDTLYFYLVAIWHDDSPENAHNWSHTALFYRPTLQAYPAVLRLLQCVRRYRDSKDRRHLLNTGKYTFSALTVIASGIRKAFPSSIPVLCMYILIATISTFYSWCWDTMMDWDIGYRKFNFLRARLMYRRPWVYYTAAILDLIFRAIWAVTLGTTTHTVSFTNPMTTISSMTEITRRFTWNIFRLENEHLKNCNSSNATAIPALLSAYKKLHSASHQNINNAISPENIKLANNNNKIPVNNTSPNNILNTNNSNNNMQDYEREDKDEDDLENELEEPIELVEMEGIRHRHVAIGAETE